MERIPFPEKKYQIKRGMIKKEPPVMAAIELVRPFGRASWIGGIQQAI